MYWRTDFGSFIQKFLERSLTRRKHTTQQGTILKNVNRLSSRRESKLASCFFQTINNYHLFRMAFTKWKDYLSPPHNIAQLDFTVGNIIFKDDVPLSTVDIIDW